jgi:hypothetical protein
VPGLKDKADFELVREDGAHPEIRVDGKKMKADYGDFDSLKKTLLTSLGKAK